MFTILNRLRGTYSWFAKINGVALGLFVYLFTKDLDIAIMCAFGYVAGESFGWGEWRDNIAQARINTVDKLEGEGKNNGILYIATRLVPSWDVEFMRYCYTALIIRGFYWWVLAIAPIIFITWWAIVAIFLLAVAFPLTTELGYRTAKLFNFKMMDGGVEHGEVWYGLAQDVVIISLFIYVIIK